MTFSRFTPAIMLIQFIMGSSTLTIQPKQHSLRILACLDLTPKGRSPFFGPFLKFGHAIVDAIYVQKISNFW
jgi:hypothetical protein